ncbi:MAG: hypothetical protein FJ265_03520 [Planctomycetes bacterium]|nr:hypothetical protein [Planctomycetota bacterium]
MAAPFRVLSLALVGLLGGFAGCTVIELPKDFLVLDAYDGAGDYRAVTGDDARVWVREFADPNEANREFWAQAIEFDFTQQRGYELVGKGEVSNHDGLAGNWFECAANVRGERVGYLVAVWASGNSVTVVEFAARAEVFKARVDSVRAALRTLRG